jgi:hypothetical protein
VTDELAAALRESLAESGFDPEWVDEAIARASAVPTDDARTVCAAAIAAIQERLDAMGRDTAALMRTTEAAERNARADDATYGIAINRYADVEHQPDLTIH